MKEKRVTEESDHYGYGDVNFQPVLDPVGLELASPSYRKRKKQPPSENNKKLIKVIKKSSNVVNKSSKGVKEDDDYYNYNDTNAEAGVDNDFSAGGVETYPVGVFRRHKRNVVKLVRKVKKNKRCKCN
jgi:hypothetical protein